MPSLDESAYQQAFRKTKNPTLITDDTFQIEDVNEAVVEMSGYTREELVGMSPNELIDGEDIWYEIAESMVTGETWSGNIEFKTKDNRTIFGRGSAVPILDNDDEIIAFAGIFTDLTQRRRYEDTLKILNRVLRHNLKNDANVIMGYINAVSESIEDEQNKKFLGKAENKITSLLHHSDTARNLEALLSTDDEETIRPVRIDAVVENQIRSARTQFENAEFTFNHPDGEHVTAMADDSLYEVIMSILDNAVKHNNEDTPKIELEIEETSNFVELSITDNGPGIRDEHKDLIFGREERDQLHHGQGFSLFFVDQVMQKYNGDIWAENNDEEGATFTLKLPRPSDPVQVDPATDAASNDV